MWVSHHPIYALRLPLRVKIGEQTINHAYQSNMKPNQADALRPPMHAHASDLPPAFRRDEHFSGHSTYANYKDTPAYAEHGEEVRRMVPTPQRQHTDGTGRVYTKSPDYAQNYGKTKRPAAKQIIDGA